MCICVYVYLSVYLCICSCLSLKCEAGKCGFWAPPSAPSPTLRSFIGLRSLLGFYRWSFILVTLRFSFRCSWKLRKVVEIRSSSSPTAGHSLNYQHLCEKHYIGRGNFFAVGQVYIWWRAFAFHWNTFSPKVWFQPFGNLDGGFHSVLLLWTALQAVCNPSQLWGQYSYPIKHQEECTYITHTQVVLADKTIKNIDTYDKESAKGSNWVSQGDESESGQMVFYAYLKL